MRPSRSKKVSVRHDKSPDWGLLHPEEVDTDTHASTQREDLTLDISRWQAVRGDCDMHYQGDLLYKTWTESTRSKVISQLVLPTSYREAILRVFHQAPFADHLGWKKTTSCLKDRFHWSRLREDVEDMCHRCQTCQKTAHRMTHKVPLVPLSVMQRPYNS